MGHEVGGFFDEQAESYGEYGNEPNNEAVARRIESRLSGSVLSIGGLWDQARVDGRCRVTVADLSRRMLRNYADRDVALVQSDACRLAFASESTDHVVFPLILHHIAGRSGREARRYVRQVLGEAHRIVRPGGWIWISELCVSGLLYGTEILAAPLTRRFLALAGQPLVVMHSRSFYQSALAEAGWEEISAERIDAEGSKPFDLVVPILGMPWLRIPRFSFPLRSTLIAARRPLPRSST